MLGCSFTYGLGLDEKETFSAVLSRYTGRTVYNFGLSGGSPREALYILREDKETLDKLLTPKPDRDVEYVIFTYIEDHLGRLYSSCREFSPNFKFDKKK